MLALRPDFSHAKSLTFITRIIIMDHWHQRVHAFNNIWFSCSVSEITEASSANWNQWRGSKFALNFCDFINWMKVLKHILNVKGERQSPWRTPRPTLIKGVLKCDVIIVVLKFEYKSFTRWSICSGIWWHLYTADIKLWCTEAFFKSSNVTINDCCFKRALSIMWPICAVCSNVPDSFWNETFLQIVFYIVVFLKKFKYFIPQTCCKYF